MENRRSEDDEVPQRMWQAMETGTREIRVGKAERRRSKGRIQKKKKREEEEEEAEKGEDNGGEESSRGMEDIG